MGYVPDNHDIDRYVINEQDRLERLSSRFERELGIERFEKKHINREVNENMEDKEDGNIIRTYRTV